jgi:hypothetical protein
LTAKSSKTFKEELSCVSISPGFLCMSAPLVLAKARTFEVLKVFAVPYVTVWVEAINPRVSLAAPR